MIETDTNYLARRIGEGDLIAFPRYFEIETINACNARCPMCTISDWVRQPSVMKDELFERIAAEIEQHPEVERVHLYRDGEPLMDKKLAKRIKRLKDGGIKKVGISTNAELLTEEKSVGLLEAGLDEIILSVDSLKKEVYDKIRVGLDFYKVKDNCIRFTKMRERMGAHCKIRIRMIRQELNSAEWADESFQFFWSLYTSDRDMVEYRDIHNWGGQLEGFKAISPADTVRPCIALWSLMVIFVDGTVPLCNVDYNAKFPLGNVKDQSIVELWQSHEQNRRRKLHLDGQRSAISPCTNCTVWSEKKDAA